MGIEPKSETPRLVDSGDGPSFGRQFRALRLARPSIQTCDRRARSNFEIGNHLCAR
jgi:hypothetical protein